MTWSDVTIIVFYMKVALWNQTINELLQHHNISMTTYCVSCDVYSYNSSSEEKMNTQLFVFTFYFFYMESNYEHMTIIWHTNNMYKCVVKYNFMYKNIKCNQ